MSKNLKITIVGGGTAGWMTASFLRKFYPEHFVTLIESKKIGTIGVGESVTPHVTEFFNSLGIPEHDWMRETNSVYKLANRFVNWVENKNEYQYFGFNYTKDAELIFKDNSDIDIIKQFGNPFSTSNTDCLISLLDSGKANRFDESFNPTFFYMEKNVAPFKNSELLINQPSPKSNHINAELVGPFLRDKFEPNKKVSHIIADVVKVAVQSTGVTHLVLDNGQLVSGDLFIDATGFANVLMRNFNLKEKLYEYPITGAVVAQADYVDQSSEMVNYSQSIAERNGWRFRIGLWDRLGNGYCFNDTFETAEGAAQLLKQRVGKTRAEPRLIKWTPKRLTTFALKNVVSVGLGSGFIEPLEANGLFIVSASIRCLDNVLKEYKTSGSLNWKPMNDQMSQAIDDIYDFLIVHYTLTKRSDTDFWNEMALLGKKLNHEQLMLDKYNNYSNSMKSALEFKTLYPDYMWAQMAHYYKLDLSKWTKPIDTITLELNRSYFEYKVNKHRSVSDVCQNNYEWHKSFIFKD